MNKPLAVDLFAGLGGWTDGLMAAGYCVVGFDVERHSIPVEEFVRPSGDGWETVSNKPKYYPAQLVLHDVLTLHGSQFRDAAIIVASPPCQNYSYLAMPWSRSKDPNNSKAAKALRLKWETEGPDNRLFDACFRIQREAIQARMMECQECSSRLYAEANIEKSCPQCFIPLIVENVRGAQPWVGRSAWNYGSFHLWGDVPALMPINLKRAMKRNPDGTGHPPGSWFRIADSSQGARRENGVKQLHSRGGNNTAGRHRMGLGAETLPDGQKVPIYSDPRRNGGKSVHLTSPQENADGTKIGGDWFSDPNSTCRKHGSRSNARKAASAQIAKIPFELARHIARTFFPTLR